MSETAGALLSGDAAARARPLRAWSASDQERLARAVGDAIALWRSAWELPDPRGGAHRAGPGGATVVCEPWTGVLGRGAGADPGGWRPVDDTAWGLWWAPRPAPGEPACSHAAVLEALSDRLFGDPAREAGGAASPLASEVLRGAWADCRGRIARAVGATSAASPARATAEPATAMRPWSGAVVLTVPWWERRIALLLAGDCAEALLAPGAPARREHGTAREPVPVLAALAGRPARLRIQTAPFQLNLGALASASVGDVLRTTHGLTAPLVVGATGPDGRAIHEVCGAYLGRAGAARAVELLRVVPRPGPGP